MTWTIPASVRSMEVDDCLVVFNPDVQGFVELDRSGSHLWALLMESRWDQQATVDRLVSTYDLGEAEAVAMVARFLNDLLVNGMITRSTS